jgi:hypothetical protein
LNSTDYPTGVPLPITDNGAPGVYDTSIPSLNQLLYNYDDPAMNLGIWGNATLYDIAYEERDFAYTLQINMGNGVSATSTVHVGQTIIAKLGGTVFSPVWQPISNTVSTSNIPSCLITTTKVQAALSASDFFSTIYPININARANDPNPNP